MGAVTRMDEWACPCGCGHVYREDFKAFLERLQQWLPDDDSRTAGQKLAAVRRLHQQYRPAFGDRDVCAHCTQGMLLVYWPCPTIQIIDGLTAIANAAPVKIIGSERNT